MKRIGLTFIPLAVAGCVSTSGSGGTSAVAQMAATPTSNAATTSTTTTTFNQVASVQTAFQTDPVQDASFADLINGVRSSNGAPPLTYNGQLDLAAQGHADDMLAKDYFSHTSADGRTLADRVSATGYVYTAIGENIAQGQQSEQAALDGWVASPGHQRNNINPNFEEFGLGRAGTGGDIRWVLVFGAQ